MYKFLTPNKYKRLKNCLEIVLQLIIAGKNQTMLCLNIFPKILKK